MAEPVLAVAVEHLDRIGARRERVGDRAGAVGRVVVDDQDPVAAGGDPVELGAVARDDPLDIQRLVVGGDDDPGPAPCSERVVVLRAEALTAPVARSCRGTSRGRAAIRDRAPSPPPARAGGAAPRPRGGARRRRAVALGGGRAGGADRRADRRGRGGRRPSHATATARPRSGFSARSGGWPATARTRSPPSSGGRERGDHATLAYTPGVRIAGAQHRELALTFDDGPGPVHAPPVSGAAPDAHAGDVLRGRGAGAVLPRRRPRRSSSWATRSAITPGATGHGRAVSRRSSRPSCSAGARRSARTARRSRGCSARRTATGTRPRCSCCTSTRC